MILKIVGFVFLLFGVFTLKFFPDISTYQREETTKAGILVGLIAIFVGIGLLIWG